MKTGLDYPAEVQRPEWCGSRGGGVIFWQGDVRGQSPSRPDKRRPAKLRLYRPPSRSVSCVQGKVTRLALPKKAWNSFVPIIQRASQRGPERSY